MKFLFALWLLFAPTPKVPSLSVDLTPAMTIVVKNIDPESVTACTVFVSEDELLPDGTVYAPRHCLATLDGPAWPSYTDDWDFIPYGHAYDLHAEVFFDGVDAPVWSNVVRGVYRSEAARP